MLEIQTDETKYTHCKSTETFHRISCYEIVWSHLQCKKYSWFSTTATSCVSLSTQYSYLILCLSCLKSS